jgi:hypothetical protein
MPMAERMTHSLVWDEVTKLSALFDNTFPRKKQKNKQKQKNKKNKKTKTKK